MLLESVGAYGVTQLLVAGARERMTLAEMAQEIVEKMASARFATPAGRRLAADRVAFATLFARKLAEEAREFEAARFDSGAHSRRIDLPASTVTIWPVIERFSSTAMAIAVRSSTSTLRARGVLATRAAIASALMSAGGMTTPGAIAFTRTSGPSATARLLHESVDRRLGGRVRDVRGPGLRRGDVGDEEDRSLRGAERRRRRLREEERGAGAGAKDRLPVGESHGRERLRDPRRRGVDEGVEAGGRGRRGEEEAKRKKEERRREDFFE